MCVEEIETRTLCLQCKKTGLRSFTIIVHIVHSDDGDDDDDGGGGGGGGASDRRGGGVVDVVVVLVQLRRSFPRHGAGSFE